MCNNKSPCTEINIGEVYREFNESVCIKEVCCVRRGPGWFEQFE